MEDVTNNNAALMNQILQLEQERDELQHDVEQLCMQQSGARGSLDVFCQIQARRIAVLGQELEKCRQKLAVCTTKNHKLEEELSEVYHIKSQFADLLKVETDKNLEVEKDVKFFQSKVAAALAERDRVLLEVEKSYEKEQVMMVKVKQVQDRLDQITSDYDEQKRHCKDLQRKLDEKREECLVFQKVVDLFWDLRCKVHGIGDIKRHYNRANILLEDSSDCWLYGDTNKAVEDGHRQAEEARATLTVSQEEFQAPVASLACLQGMLEEEHTSQGSVEEQDLLHREKMLHLAGVIDAKMRTLQSCKVQFNEELIAVVKEKENWACSLSEAWQAITNGATTLASPTQTNEKLGVKLQVMEYIEDDSKDTMEPADDKQEFCSKLVSKESFCDNSSLPRQSNDVLWDDSKDAFVRALHEKVSALLLLSQEQERHILEENTSFAMEYQISELNRQLSQVINEKVKALVELAYLHEELQKSQDRERQLNQMLQQRHGTIGSSRLLPAILTDGAFQKDIKCLTNCDTYDRKGLSSHGYLKYSLRGS